MSPTERIQHMIEDFYGLDAFDHGALTLADQIVAALIAQEPATVGTTTEPSLASSVDLSAPHGPVLSDLTAVILAMAEVVLLAADCRDRKLADACRRLTDALAVVGRGGAL